MKHDIRKNASPTGDHVFQATGTIFELFHDDWTINMAFRVLTSHVFQPTGTIFELIQDIIGTNLVTKFHDSRTINVASRVLIRKNAPPTSDHVFKATKTIFQLIQDIIGTILLTKFHEDWTINVASRVLTRFYYSHIRKNAPPLGSHVFQANVTIFELIQDIIGTNLLTKFHEDWTINVASRCVNKANVDAAQRMTDKRRSQKLTMSTLCSGELPTLIKTESVIPD
ncbi:hypothetical protein DPMN_090653 [Dreissena polymorpha]|uniref:Uncharacterized protein n=1 Tax=Dreissena polymorpha TaxID=45954 RepID=A0A9D4QYI3_DREPO|nr:hypothetical protein DPMN_090653 [Dreissena polymorpha]